MHGIVSGLYQWRHVRKSTNFQRKLDNLEVFNNDKSLGFCLRKQQHTIIVKPILSSACMSLISATKNA